MPVSDEDIERFKQGLREMSDEALQVALDTGAISLTWKRSYAEMERKRRADEEWAARFAAQESARVKAQKFQATQMEEQLEVAKGQAEAAKPDATTLFTAPSAPARSRAQRLRSQTG